MHNQEFQFYLKRNTPYICTPDQTNKLWPLLVPMKYEQQNSKPDKELPLII